MRLLLQTHPDQRSDDPELVGRIALELGVVDLIGIACAEVAIVLLERRRECRLRQVAQLADRIDADRGRGEVEIAELGRAGDVGNRVLLHAARDRGVEIGAKLVAHAREIGRALVLAEHARDPGRVLQPEQHEHAVPVGMHRVLDVALVADRFRHEAVVDPLAGLLILGGPALLPQLIDVGDRAGQARPHLGHAGRCRA